ncbi:MAG: ribbon-helix-helix protein, CopG family [Burkholderiales bacterium]|nr:ribbon-helix-helix protein, CopG family [Burkholderiales bacterium]
MDAKKRATVYVDSDLHRALRLKAAATDRSISEIVNEAVRRILAEDAADLAAIEHRTAEPEVDFAVVVKNMKRRGRI